MAQLPDYDPVTLANKSFDANLRQYLDTEHTNIKAVLDAARSNLQAIQRDDQKLANDSVHPDALDIDTLDLMGGWTPKGDWTTSTAYEVGDEVRQNAQNYVCVIAHTSGTFSTDLSNGRWMAVGAGSDLVLDEDDFSSDSTSKAPSQQSTSTYITNNTVLLSTFNAKGDLVAGTANNAASRLPVGANGKVLQANSGESTGLEWGDKVEPVAANAVSSGTTTLTDATLSAASHYIQPVDISANSPDVKLPAASSANKGKLVTMRISEDDGADTSSLKGRLLKSDDSEFWTGVREGDFATVYSTGSDWDMLDHFESFYALVYVSSNQTIGNGGHEQVTNDALQVHYGSWWSTTNSEGTLPWDAWIGIAWHVMGSIQASVLSASIKLGASFLVDASNIGTSTGSVTSLTGHLPHASGRFKGTASQALQLFVQNHKSDANATLKGSGSANASLATIKLTRRY